MALPFEFLGFNPAWNYSLKLIFFFPENTIDCQSTSITAGFILKTLAVYSTEWWAAGVSTYTRHCLATITPTKCLQTTNRILCHESETLVRMNFFQLKEWCCSRGSVLIQIYHDLKKKKKCACTGVVQTASCVEYYKSSSTVVFCQGLPLDLCVSALLMKRWNLVGLWQTLASRLWLISHKLR